MRFTKMHGLGNDYVYINAFVESLPGDLPGLAIAISDRHRGVGGDGMILIGPTPNGDARMRMFNADGSESEMCGNGVRCVAKYVHDHGLSANNPLRIETGRGVLTLELTLKNDKVGQVRVDMGEPILDASQIPTTFSTSPVINQPLPAITVPSGNNWLEECGVDPRMTCVSMGNPHAVIYCADVARIPLTEVGSQLEISPVFPRKANIHFVQVVSRGEVIMRTWERGSGITQACGTGASAVCVGGVLTGRTDRTLLAHLPGGDLHLEWAELDNHLYMTGPATEVFSGDWNHSDC